VKQNQNKSNPLTDQSIIRITFICFCSEETIFKVYYDNRTRTFRFIKNCLQESFREIDNVDFFFSKAFFKECSKIHLCKSHLPRRVSLISRVKQGKALNWISKQQKHSTVRMYAEKKSDSFCMIFTTLSECENKIMLNMVQ
jgi:hypothetical protein